MVKEHDHFKKLIAKHEVSVESKNANSTLADELLSKTTPTIDIDSAIDDLNTPAKTETVAKVSEQPQFPQFDADEPLTDIPTNTEEQELIDDQPTPTIDIDSAIEDLNTQAKTEAVDKAPEQPEQTFDTNELTEIPSINNKEITEDESPGKLPKSKDSSSSKDK